MLYRTTLLRAFSASLLISVLTACGGSGSGAGDGTTPTGAQPATQPTNNNGGTGDTSGTGGTGTTNGTGTTGGAGDTTGTGTTGGIGDTTGTGTTGGTGDTNGAGATGDTSGTGGTGAGGTGNTGGAGGTGGVDSAISGVWELKLKASLVSVLESLPGNYPGIVDEWLPGHQILVIDHSASMEVSTCIDNLNLPPMSLTRSGNTNTYTSNIEWTFGSVAIKPRVVKQTDGSFKLFLVLGGVPLEVEVVKRKSLNNEFVLQGDRINSVDSTNLTCAVKTPATDGSKTLNVTTWYEDSFLYLTFPAIADVGHYDYGLDEVSLNSESLYYLPINTAIDSAQLDLSLYEPGKLKLDFDLQTYDAVQLHGEVTLQENPLSATD